MRKTVLVMTAGALLALAMGFIGSPAAEAG
jgi:hypothetical protein